MKRLRFCATFLQVVWLTAGAGTIAIIEHSSNHASLEFVPCGMACSFVIVAPLAWLLWLMNVPASWPELSRDERRDALIEVAINGVVACFGLWLIAAMIASV